MKKKLLIAVLIGIGLLSLGIQAEDESTDNQEIQTQDATIVKTIFSANDLNWSFDNRIKTENERIIFLDLSQRDFSSPGIKVLPPEIGDLSELRTLIINDNDLTTLPKELFNCKKLKKLEIRSNSLMIIPASLKQLVHLQELDLRNNELDHLNASIGSLKSLKKLQLWGNRLTTLPPQIGKLSKLQELFLNGNRLTELPESIRNLRINYIDVQNNYLCNPSKTIDKWLKRFDRKYKGIQNCLDQTKG